jgi:hypothetical protein
MSYTVQFVGLACFLRNGSGREVLLPDGRTPPDGIEPHVATIVVAPGSVRETGGWNGDPAILNGVFELPPCEITLEGADGEGSLETRQHDGLLPQLRRIDPNFEIDPDRAVTIARVRVNRGTLTAYRIPGGVAVMSQLDVPHDGEIHITVTPRDGSEPRRIVLQPQTEIVVSNTGRGGYHSMHATSDHFRIYEKLSARPVRLREPDEDAVAPPSPTRHLFFARNTPMGLSSGCSNTGCC